MRQVAVTIAGLLGLGLLLLGAVLLVSGLQSHDSWGFGAMFASLGVFIAIAGAVLLAVARAAARRGKSPPPGP